MNSITDARQLCNPALELASRLSFTNELNCHPARLLDVARYRRSPGADSRNYPNQIT